MACGKPNAVPATLVRKLFFIVCFASARLDDVVGFATDSCTSVFVAGVKLDTLRRLSLSEGILGSNFAPKQLERHFCLCSDLARTSHPGFAVAPTWELESLIAAIFPVLVETDCIRARRGLQGWLVPATAGRAAGLHNYPASST